MHSWFYSIVHNSACLCLEEQTLWGQTVCRVWLPNQDAVVRVPRSALRPLSADLQPEIEAGRIAYVAAAAKVAEVLEGATGTTDGQVLLADEVGLGKTIEAGLVVPEFKLRGLRAGRRAVEIEGQLDQGWDVSAWDFGTHEMARRHRRTAEDQRPQGGQSLGIPPGKNKKTGVITLDVLAPRRYILIASGFE